MSKSYSPFFKQKKNSEKKRYFRLLRSKRLDSQEIKLMEDSGGLKIGSKIKNLKVIKEKTKFVIPKTLVLGVGVFDELLLDNKISNPLKYNWSKFRVSKKYQKLILQKINLEFGNKPLVIRSSATCEDSPFLSFAGQYSSFLNIKGKKKIIQAIKMCYQSLFSENAKVYASINKINLQNEKMAIAIQELSRVKRSGVIFTVDPVSKNEEIMIVEYTDGLGDSVVSGHQKPTQKIIKKEEVGRLQDGFLKKLSKMALMLEKIFLKPQDIEWGYDGKKIYVFQSRNITTLNKKPKLMKYDLRGTSVLGTGISACDGVSRGTLRVVRKNADYDKIKKGDIVYVGCKISNSLILKMPLISALIIEGGILSHFAVISRELNIPCLTSPIITNRAIRLKENKKIIIDAFLGKIIASEEKKRINCFPKMSSVN